MKEKDAEMKKFIGESLKKFFDEKGMTQKSIADKLGITTAYVNKILNGNKGFSFEQANKWHDLFGVSETFLLSGTGSVEESHIDLPNGVTKESLTQLPKEKLVDLVIAAFELANKHITTCQQIIKQNDDIIKGSKAITLEMVELCKLSV